MVGPEEADASSIFKYAIKAMLSITENSMWNLEMNKEGFCLLPKSTGTWDGGGVTLHEQFQHSVWTLLDKNKAGPDPVLNLHCFSIELLWLLHATVSHPRSVPFLF